MQSVAVYYRPDDYAGVIRRLVIDAVDTTVAVVATLLFGATITLFVPDETASILLILAGTPLIWFLYFVVLKRSRFRTAGYIVAGARIVNLRGERPGYLALTGRLGFVILGPFNFLVDLLWVSSDPCRQALRDKIAHTYVVRKAAVPAGTGRIVYRVYTVFCMTLLCAESDGAPGS